MLLGGYDDNWRILSPNAISPNLTIPAKYDYYNIDEWIGENYFFVSFRDDNTTNTYNMIVFDLNGNLVNEVQTIYDNWDWSDSYGDRMNIYYYDPIYMAPAAAFALVTPTSVEYAYDLGQFWNASNDWEWQQDYWC
jgi:hypothetical protein